MPITDGFDAHGAGFMQWLRRITLFAWLVTSIISIAICGITAAVDQNGKVWMAGHWGIGALTCIGATGLAFLCWKMCSRMTAGFWRWLVMLFMMTTLSGIGTGLMAVGGAVKLFGAPASAPQTVTGDIGGMAAAMYMNRDGTRGCDTVFTVKTAAGMKRFSCGKNEEKITRQVREFFGVTSRAIVTFEPDPSGRYDGIAVDVAPAGETLEGTLVPDIREVIVNRTDGKHGEYVSFHFLSGKNEQRRLCWVGSLSDFLKRYENDIVGRVRVTFVPRGLDDSAPADVIVVRIQPAEERR